MECKNLSLKNAENPTEKKNGCTVSLLEGDENFFNRILSRDSSKGFSSRIYYRTAEGVPFKWETQPGQPKNRPTKGSIIPPLSPPPAVLSSGLAQPSFQPAKGLSRSKIWFWKKSKRIQQSMKSQTGLEEDAFNMKDLDSVKSFEFWSSDCDSVSSPGNSNSPPPSSSSPSSSSFNGSSLPSLKFLVPRSPKVTENFHRREGNEEVDLPWSCTPWNFPGVLVCVARRI